MDLFSKSRSRRFEQLAKPLFKPLYQAALRMTRNREWAEDITQETLIRAYERFDQFEEGTNFRAWLFTILTRVYINDYERGKRRPLTTSFDSGVEGSTWDFPAPPQSDPAVLLTENLLDEKLQKALDSLPEEYRTVVLLVDVEELSYQETADALNIPVGTVRSRVSRGRALLRQMLTGMEPTARKQS